MRLKPNCRLKKIDYIVIACALVLSAALAIARQSLLFNRAYISGVGGLSSLFVLRFLPLNFIIAYKENPREAIKNKRALLGLLAYAYFVLINIFRFVHRYRLGLVELRGW